MILIDSIEAFDYAIDSGLNPLMDWQRFTVAFPLRVFLQNKLFGKNYLGHGSVLVANDKFYHYCWENHWLLFGAPIHCCEECQKPLHDYSSVYISHILSRGSNADLAHDPRNFNLLCYKHHMQWESERRYLMKIYRGNLRVIDILKSEYL